MWTGCLFFFKQGHLTSFCVGFHLIRGIVFAMIKPVMVSTLRFVFCFLKKTKKPEALPESVESILCPPPLFLLWPNENSLNDVRRAERDMWANLLGAKLKKTYKTQLLDSDPLFSQSLPLLIKSVHKENENLNHDLMGDLKKRRMTNTTLPVFLMDNISLRSHGKETPVSWLYKDLIVWELIIYFFLLFVWI